MQIIKVCTVLVTVALAACHTPRAGQVSVAAGPAPSVSWEGTYRGTVQITALGSGIQRQWCETNPQIVVEVTDNAFSYAMPHPNAPDNPTPVYAATIASDGSFNAILGSGVMSGRIVGARMSGTIDGSVCVYSFSMDRS